MAPRAYWKGYLRLSLVSCPIQLFPATSEREKIRFHQLNRETGNRVRYRKVDESTGDEVEQSDIVKGYEVDKGSYIELTSDELEAAAIESTRMIDIDQFVAEKEIDELYIANPYYIVPDGEVGAQAFAVIREAIKQEGMVALARVVFTSREHVIALKPRAKGLVGFTVRYPYEVRKEDEYFDEIPDEKVTKDMLDLARHIVESKTGHFHPDKFEDHYENALKDLLKKKQHGEKIVAAKGREPAKIINLMDALKRSAKGDTARPAERSSARRSNTRTAKKSTRSRARHRKAG
jgi:DNA end-binding protein Ku